MATSFTGKVIANDWTTVSSLTGVTFTSGNKFNMTVTGECQFKNGNYIQPVRDPIKNEVTFDYIANSNDLYIRTGANGCTLAVLDCGVA